MSQKLGGVGEHLAAGGVIRMMVAIGDHDHILAKAGLDLALDPGGGALADRIDQQHAHLTDQEDPVVEIVLKAVEVAGHVLDRPLRLTLRPGTAETGQK